MKPSKRVLPKNVHFTYDPCLILADMNPHLLPDYQALLARYPYADGLRDFSCLSAVPTDAENLMQAVREGRYSYICIGWLIFNLGFINSARHKGMSPTEYADWIYQQCRDLNSEVGYQAAWIEAYGEIGNSVTWPAGQTFTKAEALEYFRNWFRSGRSNTEHWRSVSPPETINFFTHAQRQDENFRNLPVYYSEGTIYAIHEAFRAGFPMVVYEGACGSRCSFQTGIAFTRGGAKMFDAFWGVDLSVWGGGPSGDEVRVNDAGVRREGMTSDFLYRIWITSYLSGCNTFLHEVGHLFLYTWCEDDVLPSEYGFKAMHFYQLVRGVLADRGRPVSPFAIMLETEHGYHNPSRREYSPEGQLDCYYGNSSPAERLGIWAGTVESVTRGDWQVHRMMQEIWPFSDNLIKTLSGRWPDEKDVDFDDYRENLCEAVSVGEVDPRQNAAYLRDTTWADCFDVITEDATVDALSRHYQAVLAAGDIRTDDGLWSRLCGYVEQGGEVILTVDQLDSQAREELGLADIGQPKEVKLQTVNIGSQAFSSDETVLLYDVALMQGKFNVWAADAKTNQPLVLELPRKAGRFYLVLCSDGVNRDATKTCSVMKLLIDHLYAKYVGVKIVGPACQMLVNRRENDTLVTLLNHTSAEWRGEVELTRSLYPQVAEVREIIGDRAYPADLVKFKEESVSVKICVSPYEVKVISFGPLRQTSPCGDVRVTRGPEDDDVAFLSEIQRRGPRDVLGTVEEYDRKRNGEVQ